MQIPQDLEEAALVDGATRLVALRRVVIPVAIPGMFTAGIIAFILAWNDFAFAVSFLETPSHFTAPLAIVNLGQSQFQVFYNRIDAAVVIITIPVALLVLLRPAPHRRGPDRRIVPLMAPLRFIDVSKVYPNGVEAVSHLSLDVEDGEFIVLVGPSGCGKTTALRMVAGLEDVTDGDNRDRWPRRQRPVAPRTRHRDGLPELRAVPAHDGGREHRLLARDAEDAEGRGAARRSRMPPACSASPTSCDRKPAQLSGGQRQRVAMGRAIVREPAAFLMDEPLSNLDAKLRVHMRAEVSRIQRRLGVATLYVTHDQVEAMTMGDRVAVMRVGTAAAVRATAGALRQAREPVRRRVHRLARDEPLPGRRSTPRARSIAARRPAARRYPPTLTDEARHRPLPRAARRGRDPARGPRRRARSALTAQRASDFEGTVDLVEELGAEKLVHFHIDAERLSASDELLAGDDEETEGLLDAGEIGTATASAGVARIASRGQIAADQEVDFTVDTTRLHLFDPDEGSSLRQD